MINKIRYWLSRIMFLCFVAVLQLQKLLITLAIKLHPDKDMYTEKTPLEMYYSMTPEEKIEVEKNIKSAFEELELEKSKDGM